jgi:hypothetical protein
MANFAGGGEIEKDSEPPSSSERLTGFLDEKIMIPPSNNPNNPGNPSTDDGRD